MLSLYKKFFDQFDTSPTQGWGKVWIRLGHGLDKVRTKSKVWVRLGGVIRVGFAASLPRPCPNLAQTLLFAYR